MREKGYLVFLRAEGKCVACNVNPYTRNGQLDIAGMVIDPAHGPCNGASSKGPDNEAIPLCRGHHQEQHRLTWPNFELRYGFDRKHEAAAWYLVYQIRKEGEA